MASLPSKTVDWAGSAICLGRPHNNFHPLLIGPFPQLLETIFLVPSRVASVWGHIAARKRLQKLGCWDWLGQTSSSCSGCCGHQGSGPGFLFRSQLPQPKAQTRGLSKVQGLRRWPPYEPFQPSVPIFPPIPSGGFKSGWSILSVRALRWRWQSKGSIHVFMVRLHRSFTHPFPGIGPQR